MSQSTLRVSGALVVLVFLGLLLGGCKDEALDSMAPTGSASDAADDAQVVTAVSFETVTGKLPGPAHIKLKDQVRDVVDGWIDAAYVGGDYPRTSFTDSWPGFTAGAQAEAERDADLMSNQDLGDQIDGVEATKRAVRIDVLAVKQRPVGVTAHVLLRFDTTGEKAKRVQVTGRLYLSPGKQGWQVFGYDVVKGDIR